MHFAGLVAVTDVNNIRYDLFFALFYNAVGVLFDAGVLYPAFGLLLKPMVAAAAISFDSVPVAGSSCASDRKRAQTEAHCAIRYSNRHWCE